jgi:vacuolar-type H+-ATPase subunit F/Vma7
LSIAIIGSSDFVLGFGLAGAHTNVVATKETLLSEVERQRSAAIIVVEGTLFDTLPPAAQENLSSSIAPVVLALHNDGDERRMRSLVVTTLGIDPDKETARDTAKIAKG